MLLAAACALGAVVPALPAEAQTSPRPYTALLFNPNANHWVFRSMGDPWICVQDGRCTRLKFDRVNDADLAAADIVSLGFADRAFYLALQHQRYQDGRQQVFRCTADGCSRFELDPGEFTFLGTFAVKDRDRTVAKTAILAKHDKEPTRSRLLWCADSGCSENEITRDNRYDLAFMGAATVEGRARFWLRDQSGQVLSCAQPEADADRLGCERAAFAYPEFPAGPAQLDQAALAAAIDAALKGGNYAEAERLLAEGEARFPGQSAWAPLRQRLAQARAEGDNRLKIEQARRLVIEARRYAAAGNFPDADALLADAQRLAPTLPEIAQARAEFARLRAEREQRFRERSAYVSAIEQAFTAFRLWEAESLIAEGERRFANDPAFRGYRARLTQIRAQAEWQRRMRVAREHLAAARQAMDRGDFRQADRELDQAEGLAPGLPEIRAARADLARQRIDAEWQADEIRQITAAIEAAIGLKRWELAERLLADGSRRYQRHPGWAPMQRRIEQAKRGDGQGDRDQAARTAKAKELVAAARRDAAAGRFAEAERAIKEAEGLAPTLPELAAARTEIARLKRDADAKDKDAVRKLVAEARAALAKKDLVAAERAVAEAEKRDRDAAEVKAVRADLERAKRDAAGDRDKSERVKKFVADARAALQRKDLGAAERAVVEAEKLDKDAAEVKAARADLDKAKRDAAGDNKAERVKKFVADARAALQRKDLAAAERAVVEAEKLDKDAAEVKAVRADLDKAKRDAAGDNKAEQVKKFVADARAALQRKDLAAAERAVVEAEKLDKDAPAVKAVRADLDAAKRAPAPGQRQ